MQIFDFQSNYDFYQSYHGNVVNKLIHILCIPAIVWSTIILSSDYKFRGNNVSALLLLFYSSYYFILNPTLAMVAVPLLFYCFFHALNFKWEYPDYNKGYMVVADVARGDSTDYSACHVFDIEQASQVAEYKGRMSTKDFGNLCVNVATEYNNALLVVENNNIGWAALQQCIDRGYENLFYTSKDLKYVDTEHQINNKYRTQDRNMVAGFSMTMKTRPLVIAKLEEYFREKSVIVRSNRLIDELFVFIYNNNKAEAMQGYNDDLVMSFALTLWVRDTALRLRNEGIELTKKTLSGVSTQMIPQKPTNQTNAWEIEVGPNGEKESIDWLIN